MASPMFESYVEELLTMAAEVRHLLQTGSAGDVDRAVLQLGEADDLLRQLEVEARSATDAATRADLQAQVQAHKASLASLRTASERRQLVSRVDSSDPAAAAAQRQRLLDAGDALAQQTAMLAAAKGALLETEGVAGEVTAELGRNRETIQSAHSKVKETGSMMDEAKQLLNVMGKWYRP
eukprot:TRINITY_DN2785_c0_g1_i1.p1 TRINITY_DN2785_c0_g1~~TRINITY_DN2785_c0_g1_i1.p1  ORF type:complete len:180 (-),score=43.18 TRINITY_DN2785_c0_g1_i1:624-1163(-)